MERRRGREKKEREWEGENEGGGYEKLACIVDTTFLLKIKFDLAISERERGERERGREGERE